MDAGTTQAIAITGYDTYGNQASGYEGEKTLVFSGASVAPEGNNPTCTDNTRGTAQNFGVNTPVTFTGGAGASTMALYTAETAHVDVEDTGASIDSKAADDRDLDVVVSPANAHHLVVAGTGAMTAGDSQTITVTAKDAYGNTDTDYNGDQTLIFSGANVSPNGNYNPTCTDKFGRAVQNFGADTVLTFGAPDHAAGVTSTSMTLVKVETAHVDVEVKGGGINSTGKDTYDLDVVVSHAAAAALAFVDQPANTSLNQPIKASDGSAVSVEVQDTYGNRVTSAGARGAAVSIAMAIKTGTGAPSAALSGTSPQNTSSGLAQFADLAIDTVNVDNQGGLLNGMSHFKLEASANVRAAVTAASADFDIIPNLPPEIVADSVTPGAGQTPANQNISENAKVDFAIQFTDENDPNALDYMKKITWYLDDVEKEVTNATGSPQQLSSSWSWQTDLTTVSSGDGTHANNKDFTVKAVGEDFAGAKTTVTWTVTVNNVNQTPSITGVTLSVQGDGAPYETSTLVATPAGWSDADNDAAGYDYAWYVNSGLVAGQTANTLASARGANFKKHDQVYVKVTPNDGRPDNNTGTVKTSDTLAILNSTPVVANQAAAVDDNATKTIDLTVNASDADPTDTPTYSKVSSPAHGTATVAANGKDTTYTADWAALAKDETDNDTFTFKSNDGEADSNTATVTMTVTGVNDKPTAQDSSAYSESNTASRGTGNYATIEAMTGDDVDSDDSAATLTYKIASLPVKGTLVDKDGAGLQVGDTVKAPATRRAAAIDREPLKYTPDNDVRGTDEFTFTATDKHALASEAATVRITIGTPLWYPYFTGNEVPKPGARDNADWFHVEIWNGVPDTLGPTITLATNVPANDQSKLEMTPDAYFNAGSEGLVPGTYYWRYRGWNSSASENEYGDWQTLSSLSYMGELVVEDYGASSIKEYSMSDALPSRADDGRRVLNFTPLNSSGYQLKIQAAGNGYVETYRHVFRPGDAPGDDAPAGPDVIPLNQPWHVNVTLPPGTYQWEVTPFNPKGDGTKATADTDVVIAAEAPATPSVKGKQPKGLLPADGSVIALPQDYKSVEITFQWGSVPGATGYAVFLGATGAKPILNYRDVGAVTSIRKSVVKGNYMWKVIARDGANEFSDYSDLHTFDVIVNTSAPLIKSVTCVSNTVLTLEFVAGSPVADTVDLYHFALATGKWSHYTNQAVVEGPPHQVTVDAATFTVGDFVLMGAAKGAEVSDAKVLTIK